MIELNNVSFSYKNQEKEAGLKNVSLKILTGETVLLCGESGCGKTTVTRLINGLIPHYYEGELEGEVIVSRREMRKTPLHEAAGFVGSVFQNPRSQFFHVDTTGELMFGCENLGMQEENIKERLKRTVEQLDLEQYLHRNIFRLSGGEKQKIACGSVSMLLPEVIVLDEPSSNLDFFAIGHIREIIKKWKEEGKTIVIAEHRFHYLRGLIDKVIYMEKQEIHRSMSGEDFFSLSNAEMNELGLRAAALDELKAKSIVISSKNQMLWKGFCFRYSKSAYEKKEFYKTIELKIEKEEIPENKIIAIIGENGAGKTTLIRCLCGLEKKSKGILCYKGEKWKQKDRLKNCYMVMQDVNHQLFAESVLDEVMLSMGDDQEEQAKEILKSMDMLSKKDRHPLSLSGGEKQRVAICSALASNRSVLVFDEPTSGLDYKHMRKTTENMKKLQREGKAIFIVTHDPEFILLCCNHVLQIKNGSVAENYELDEKGIKKLLSFFGIMPKNKVKGKMTDAI